VTIEEGLRAKCKERGCEVRTNVYANESELALLQAGGSECENSVIVLCGGTTTTEGRDRPDLFVDDEDLLNAFVENYSYFRPKCPMVVLTMTPGVIVMPWADKVQGIVNVFLAGKYTGTAFADVLFGDANPSAKSPVTFPRSEADTVPPCEEIACNYSEGLFVGYLGIPYEQVLFPFGHGLSYTTFAYEMSRFAVKSSWWRFFGPVECKGALVCVQVLVQNTGDRAGVEVPQLYLTFPDGTGEPVGQLRGFQRLPELAPGASTIAIFPLFREDLQIFGPRAPFKAGFHVPDGHFSLNVGSSNFDERIGADFSTCRGRPHLRYDRPCF